MLSFLSRLNIAKLFGLPLGRTIDAMTAGQLVVPSMKPCTCESCSVACRLIASVSVPASLRVCSASPVADLIT